MTPPTDLRARAHPQSSCAHSQARSRCEEKGKGHTEAEESVISHFGSPLKLRAGRLVCGCATCAPHSVLWVLSLDICALLWSFESGAMPALAHSSAQFMSWVTLSKACYLLAICLSMHVCASAMINRCVFRHANTLSRTQQSFTLQSDFAAACW